MNKIKNSIMEKLRIITAKLPKKPVGYTSEKYVAKDNVRRISDVSKWIDVTLLGDLEKVRDNVFGITIHHTDTRDYDTAVRVLRGRSLSTHFIINKDGKITVELPLTEQAAACIGLNEWMLQLDVVGRLEESEPTEEQVEALDSLLRYLVGDRKPTLFGSKNYVKMPNGEFRGVMHNRYYKIRQTLQESPNGGLSLSDVPFDITTHGLVRPTRCPGKHLSPKINVIVQQLISEFNDRNRNRNSNGDH